MVCYSPVRAYWSKEKHPVTKNRFLVFSPSKALTTDYMTVPCGKCEGCLLDRAFSWSVRCTCESLYHKENYFVTLTYSPECLPEDGMLNRVHVQQFMKRLRRAFTGYKIRVFYCGEYGEKRRRPHYHLILFGLPLAKEGHRLYPINSSRKGNINYVTDIISSKWSYGLATVGPFSSSAAAYVAQYTLKKNKENFSYRSRGNSHTSKSSCSSFVSPFIGMSNRPAIGQQFFFEHYLDIFNRSGFNVEVGGSFKFIRPLRFFVTQLRKHYPLLYFKYCERPQRKNYYLRRVLLAKRDLNFALSVDKKRRNAIIKEARTLRKLEARADL
ncbi:replication initiator protein [Sigmofec virus UA08Rod_6251]|uniref:Replication initiator protein n=1 Tax=Sigmofec virus UA08Rod_6251 TaxID=2929226 RepID=A0A976R8H1_9VIRU|nr:replication initiator protein [Sigmofec virus UA08Rod_6251]